MTDNPNEEKRPPVQALDKVLASRQALLDDVPEVSDQVKALGRQLPPTDEVEAIESTGQATATTRAESE